jgi:SAM-dependent methyltransferase
VAADYAAFRPTYPPAFFAAFARRCAARNVVWDCGCGNGQATLDLAAQFARVEASDASGAQLAQAVRHPRIRYRQAPAQASGLAGASVDGVLVAAAIHWFAGPDFTAEVRRVARPGAAMAWIGYLPLRLDCAPLQARLDRFYDADLAPWWPPQRQLVDRAYADLEFPGREWPFPRELWIERHWDLARLLGYLGTWSAVQAAREQGVEPLAELGRELAGHWPEQGATPLLVRWPFMGRWGRIG